MEGMSIRSASRITHASRNTISKLILDVGAASEIFQDKALRDLPCKRIQCDEMWGFCYAKEKNVPDEFIGVPGFGDVWTWTALDPDSKLIAYWLVGNRSSDDAKRFMSNLASRLKRKIQLTTDGYRAYPEAVDLAFGDHVDFATIVKKYSGKGNEGVLEIEHRPYIGNPKEKHISTSLVERQNLTMRMTNRRLTRKTNAHSKSLEHMCASLSFYFMYYNFIRIHTTLKTTPAVAVGISKEPMRIEDVLEMVG